MEVEKGTAATVEQVMYVKSDPIGKCEEAFTTMNDAEWKYDQNSKKGLLTLGASRYYEFSNTENFTHLSVESTEGVNFNKKYDLNSRTLSFDGMPGRCLYV